MIQNYFKLEKEKIQIPLCMAGTNKVIIYILTEILTTVLNKFPKPTGIQQMSLLVQDCLAILNVKHGI